MRSLPLNPGRGILTLCLAAILLMFFVPLAFAATNVEDGFTTGSLVDGDPDDYGSPQPGGSLHHILAWVVLVLRVFWWGVRQ